MGKNKAKEVLDKVGKVLKLKDKKKEEKKKGVQAASTAKEPVSKEIKSWSDVAYLLNETKVSEWGRIIDSYNFKNFRARDLVNFLNKLDKDNRMEFIKVLAARNILDKILVNITKDDFLKNELDKDNARLRRHLKDLPGAGGGKLITRIMEEALEGTGVASGDARSRAREAKTPHEILLELFNSLAGREMFDFTTSLSESKEGQKNIIEFIKLIKKETFLTYIKDIDDYIELNKNFSLETRKQLMDATLLRELTPLINHFGGLRYFLSLQPEEMQLYFIKNVDVKALLSIIPQGQYESHLRAIGAISAKIGHALTERKDYKEVILPCIIIDNIENKILAYKSLLPLRKDKDSPANKAKAAALNSLMATLKMSETDKLDSNKLAAALTKFEAEYKKPETKKAFHDPGIMKFLRAIANFLSAYRHEDKINPHKKTFKHQVKRQLATAHTLFTSAPAAQAPTAKSPGKKAKK